MLTSFCCFRKCFQWYLGLSVTSCCLFLLFICSLLPVGPGTMLCPSLLQEAGPVPSTECGFKPSSTFSFPHFPSLQGPSCVSHLQAGGSRFLRHCLGADSLLGAEGPWAPVSAHDAAASLGGSVLWCVGMGVLQWQVLLAAEHQVWQLDRLSRHLSLPQSSAGVPAGFLKCKSQVQCETHPLALLFFFSLLPV